MKKLIYLTVLFLSSSILAQKYELGEVTKEELLEKVNPNDSTAVATILFQKGETRFDYSSQRGFEMITEVETKIKIYKKEGLDFANFEIETYKYGGTKNWLIFLNV